MLKALFGWLDAHPAFYWSLALGVTASAVFWAGRALCQPSPPRTRGWSLDLALVATLLAWRWPFLFTAHQLTPDEAQQVAGAVTLVHDPVFWRSIDGATAGPLNFYVLLLPHLVGAPLDFFFARLVGLLLVAGSLVILHRVLAREVGPAALPATLATTLAFALSTDWEFIHYSTEHVPLFLSTAGAALWWCARPGTEGHTRGRWFAAGLLAGLLPWAKLQALPFAALLGGSAAGLALLRSRASRTHAWSELAIYAAGFLAPSLVALALVTRAGVLSDFWLSYIARNFQYTDQGGTLSFVLREFARLTTPLRIYPAFLAACGLLMLVGLAVAAVRRQRPSTFLFAASLFALVAIVTVFSPRRGFPHYLLFSLVPLGALAGAAWHGALSDRNRPRVVLLGALLVLSGTLVGLRLTLPAPFMIGQLLHHWREPFSPLTVKVRQLLRPGDSIAVWGWMTEIYVHANLPQAVRDAHSQRQIEPGPWQAYYRDRYLADFQKNRPALFVDAVGEGAYAYQDRSAFGHETFPELRALIRADYSLVADDVHARLYVRRDRNGFPSGKP